jgi:phosphate transport system protein
MQKAFDAKLHDITDQLVTMCRAAQTIISQCITALRNHDLELATEVRAAEKQIDKLERKIEKACMRLLLMEHPAAGDFRNVYTAIKMVADLERIGDQARDIAKLTKKLAKDDAIEVPTCMIQMSDAVVQMVHDSVTSYTTRDLAVARALEEADDAVDALFKQATKEITAIIKKKPKFAKQGVALILVAKYLERVGDHAVNVGEWVQYAITGKHPK